ncbi:TPA: hypothetical protein HA318_04265 [Candidatus Micrarchaeota archaeon]|nr:MAG: hypothetical protein AUJ65_01740 [Candidatus Micrarchaeota archaeon CG1_02_51_15]HII39186.1 hypothetical protein [Candidatus Micrarchaeota archaeon]
MLFLEELQWVWWIVVFLMAYYYYNWAQEHLAFSPLLTMVVAAVLIYYLVIVYPWAGFIGWILSILMFSGILYFGSVFAPFLFRFVHKKKRGLE